MTESRLREHSTPVLLRSAEDSEAQPLSFIPPDTPPFREVTMQELLARHPRLLPVEEIEPAFSPLICLGREIRCAEGRALDLLYCTPKGYLTLVETKLWDNAEARRQVVAQLIEYAKDFSQRTFADLDRAVRAGTHPPGVPASAGILDIVRAADPTIDENTFQATISRNLQSSKSLLLIVGNAVRGDVEGMAEFLQQTPGLHFSLAVIELALYRHEEAPWPVYVQPRTVARTREVTRAVVEVHAPEGIRVEVSAPPTGTREGRRPTITEDAFFDTLTATTGAADAQATRELIDDLRALGLIRHWGASSVSMRLPDPGESGYDFTVLILRASGTFYLAYLSRLERYGRYDPAIGRRYLQGVAELTGAEVREDYTLDAPLTQLLPTKGDFLALVRPFLAEIRGAANRSAP